MFVMTPEERQEEMDDAHRSTCAVAYLIITAFCAVIVIALAIWRWL